MMETLYSPGCLAFMLGIKRQQVWRWVRAGKLRSCRFGPGRSARIRIPESAIREFLGAPENPPSQALSLPTGTESGGLPSLKEATRYLNRVFEKGLLR